jgi:hypothetical protein
MKRLLALLAGALGLRALMRRRGAQAAQASHAAELRERLAASRGVEDDREQFESGEQPVDAAVDVPEPPDVDGRRADVHARARQAMDDLKQDEEQSA